MYTDFNSLTSKQKKVYSAIEAYIKTKGIPPTVRELGEMLGEKTPGAVQGILNRLEQKGAIKREVGAARSIKLVSNNSNYANPVYIPSVKKISRRNIDNLLNIYNINKYHPMSDAIIACGDGCFMVNFTEGSIIENASDFENTLIIKRDDELKNGDIVLVLHENRLLLRKYSDVESNVKLEPHNDVIGEESFSKDEVIIVGKLIGKYTKY